MNVSRLNQILAALVLISTVTGCGFLNQGPDRDYPFYELKGKDVQLIVRRSIPACPCAVYETASGIKTSDTVGIQIALEKVYFRFLEDSVKSYGTAYSPGKKGALQQVRTIRVLLTEPISGQVKDITWLLKGNETYLDNTKGQWKDYPQGNKLMSCHYRTADGQYRIYNTYSLRDTKAHETSNAQGVYFSRLCADGEYLCGWDLKSDSASFANSAGFASTDDFIQKFDFNQIPYNGQDEVALVLWLTEDINAENYNRIDVTIEFNDGSSINLQRNFN